MLYEVITLRRGPLGGGDEDVLQMHRRTLALGAELAGEEVVDVLVGDRITSYNVCYTKLLRTARPFSGEDALGRFQGLLLGWAEVAVPLRTTVRAGWIVTLVLVATFSVVYESSSQREFRVV